MSQASRFVLDDRAVPAGERLPAPVTLHGLLSRLGLLLASRDEQRAGVARWLQHHEPLPILREQLERHGLIDQRPPRQAA